jgi:uncharacterized membrane protein
MCAPEMHLPGFRRTRILQPGVLGCRRRRQLEQQLWLRPSRVYRRNSSLSKLQICSFWRGGCSKTSSGPWTGISVLDNIQSKYSWGAMPATSWKAIGGAKFREGHARKTQILVLVVIITNVLGNVSLSHGMHQVGRIVSASPLDYVRAFANPWTILGICVLVIWMLTDLALLSRADLSFVLPVTASAYVLVAVGGHFILHDHISWARWTGIALITLGVILAEETPDRTTNGTRGRLL